MWLEHKVYIAENSKKKKKKIKEKKEMVDQIVEGFDYKFKQVIVNPYVNARKKSNLSAYNLPLPPIDCSVLCLDLR